MPENKRLFFAVNIPERIRREIFSRLSSKLPKEGLKIVPEQNIHFTLLFLGDFPEEALQELKEKAETAQLQKFELEVEEIGFFGTRVLWLGAGKGAEELTSLNNQLAQAFEIKDSGFQAHATIARNKKLHSEDFTKIAQELGKEKFFAEFAVDSFELMESILSPTGAEYSTVFSFKLND